MRITMHEQKILNAVLSCHPIKSSFAKLTKETGMARNEILDVVTDLKKIGYLNTTDKNEIYLIEDGKNYLGVNNKHITNKEPVDNSLVQLAKSEVKHEEPERKITKVTTNESDVLSSIDDLGKKLSKPVVEIKDIALKSEALTKLAGLMTDDIAELLLDVKSDLELLSA